MTNSVSLHFIFLFFSCQYQNMVPLTVRLRPSLSIPRRSVRSGPAGPVTNADEGIILSQHTGFAKQCAVWFALNILCSARIMTMNQSKISHSSTLNKLHHLNCRYRDSVVLLDDQTISAAPKDATTEPAMF